jgi:hypothetical protein
MPIPALIAAVATVASTAATIASSIEQLQSGSGASTEGLSKDKRAQLTAALVALETSAELVQEMEKGIRRNKSQFESGRDALVTAFEQAFTGIGILLSTIEARLRALEVAGVGGIKGSDVDAVFDAAKGLFNKRPDDGSAAEVRAGIQANNLVSASLLLDNLGQFSSKDLDLSSDAQLKAFSLEGSFMLRIRQIQKSIKSAG